MSSKEVEMLRGLRSTYEAMYNLLEKMKDDIRIVNQNTHKAIEAHRGWDVLINGAKSRSLPQEAAH